METFRPILRRAEERRQSERTGGREASPDPVAQGFQQLLDHTLAEEQRYDELVDSANQAVEQHNREVDTQNALNRQRYQEDLARLRQSNTRNVNSQSPVSGSDATPGNSQPSGGEAPQSAAADTCHNMDGCFEITRVKKNNPTSCEGSVIWWQKNKCDQAIECAVDLLDSAGRPIEDGYLKIIPAGKEVGGEMGGSWTCGASSTLAGFKWQCSLPHELTPNGRNCWNR